MAELMSENPGLFMCGLGLFLFIAAPLLVSIPLAAKGKVSKKTAIFMLIVCVGGFILAFVGSRMIRFE